jgi:hypothetical protein
MRDVLTKVHPLVVALAQKYPALLPQGTSVQATVMHGTSFSTDLIRYARDANRAFSVLSKRDFPRYIWVVRASKDGTPLLDFVCDPTDSRLGSFIYGLVLYGDRWQPHEAEILNTPELSAFPIWAGI